MGLVPTVEPRKFVFVAFGDGGVGGVGVVLFTGVGVGVVLFSGGVGGVGGTTTGFALQVFVG